MKKKSTLKSQKARALRWPPTSERRPNLNQVRRIPTTRFLPGTVVWAHVPYEEGAGESTRPAVVVGRCGREVKLLPGTTSLSRRRYPDRYREVLDLDVAGLTRPTGVRVTAVGVDVIEIIEIVGSLSAEDAERVLGRDHSVRHAAAHGPDGAAILIPVAA